MIRCNKTRVIRVLSVHLCAYDKSVISPFVCLWKDTPAEACFEWNIRGRFGFCICDSTILSGLGHDSTHLTSACRSMAIPEFLRTTRFDSIDASDYLATESNFNDLIWNMPSLTHSHSYGIYPVSLIIIHDIIKNCKSCIVKSSSPILFLRYSCLIVIYHTILLYI